MQKGQRIHESVLKYMEEHKDYIPAAKSSALGFRLWDPKEIRENFKSIIEDDAVSPAVGVLSDLLEALQSHAGFTQANIDPLINLISSGKPQCATLLQPTKNVIHHSPRWTPVRH